MAGGIIQNVRIAGLAGVVPGGPKPVGEGAGIPADELAKVVEKTGVRHRHIAAPGVCASDLCLAAAERLLEGLQWERESVDLLVFVSQTADHILPASSCVLHGKLRLSKQCAAFDIALGCSGYVYGLNVVAGLLAAGGYRRALLLAGDTISKVTCAEDRAVAYVFGDAGTATALEYLPGSEPMVFELGTDGSGAEHLQIPAGGFRRRPDAASGEVRLREGGNRRSDDHLFMNGAEIFNFTIREVPPLVSRLLERAGWLPESVDGWVMHQANRFMLEYLAKRMKLPAPKVVLALENYGNTSCASIPVALADRFALAGDPGRLRLVLAGFGVGFSWAAATVTLDRALLIPMFELP